ncbi:MAG: methyltransferase domain-containing protein [Opitutaceae bacterium]|nr:methyltransferase domain-containing protein [Opitutaceae bacterium]
MPEDPSRPEFWNTRYEKCRTPWDAGAVPPALLRYLETHPGRGESVLLPGCGSGYEFEAFANAGYRVTAVDFSAPAVARARDRLPVEWSEHVIEGDFFSYDFPRAPFDLIYERTFLCALPPDLWPKIVQRTAELLVPGGILAGIYFFGEKEDGPPFGLAPGEDAQLFAANFVTVANAPIPATDSLPMFAGKERWQERRRREDA